MTKPPIPAQSVGVLEMRGRGPVEMAVTETPTMPELHGRRTLQIGDRLVKAVAVVRIADSRRRSRTTWWEIEP